jgi:hypothetical protein
MTLDRDLLKRNWTGDFRALFCTFRQIEFRFSDRGQRNEHRATNIDPQLTSAGTLRASFTSPNAGIPRWRAPNPCAVATAVATHRLHATADSERKAGLGNRRPLLLPSPFSGGRSTVMQTIAICETPAIA